MAEGKNGRRKRRFAPVHNGNGGNSANGNGGHYLIINTFGTVVSATNITEALKTIGR